MAQKHKPCWWKESVIYQVYPRSFMDSNGDGIGDLKGITQKLSYLSELGIDLIWLGPINKSPNTDMGYDISNYLDIMDELGTMADFDELLTQAKKLDIGLILDLVVNHTSTTHPWFKESRKSKDNPYRDYYIWQEAADGQVPNNWVSFFGGSAWEFEANTQEYYLHLFSIQQADLNWSNPKVREEVHKIMRFWLDKGIAGFRMDVISLISKKAGLEPLPEKQNTEFIYHYATGPELHKYLHEMHEQVLQDYEVMTVGEAIGVRSHEAIDYVSTNRKELNMIFHFDHMAIDRDPKQFYLPRSWHVCELKKIICEWDTAMGEEGWNSVYFGNHDFPRMVSRFGDDNEYRIVSAKMLATLLFTLRGTPYIYNGDEIGMTNLDLEQIEDYKDIQTINAYHQAVAEGENAEDAMKNVRYCSRDNARSPMQWSDSANAGFTVAAQPWLTVNPNYREINVADSLKEPDSILNYYKQLVQLRKQNKVLVYGDFRALKTEHEELFIYTRKLKQESILVILNFSATEFNIATEDYFNPGSASHILGNYATPDIIVQRLALKPYEAHVFNLVE